MDPMIAIDNWQLERRGDGALLVRVPSTRTHAPDLPDAVFTFREGDPQFDYWEAEWRRRTGQSPTAVAPENSAGAAARDTSREDVA